MVAKRYSTCEQSYLEGPRKHEHAVSQNAKKQPKANEWS